jgi:hypothetical protein
MAGEPDSCTQRYLCHLDAKIDRVIGTSARSKRACDGEA